MVGVAFEWHDSYQRTKIIRTQSQQDESEKLHLQINYLSVKPSTIRVFQYAYCYIGLLTGKTFRENPCEENQNFSFVCFFLGPYYRYRTYSDWLEMKHGVHIHGLTFMRNRAIFGSIYILTYLLLSTVVSFSVNFIVRLFFE